MIRFGPFSADLSTKELRKNGVRIKVGGQPFAVLAALLERPGELVTRQELRKRIWADDTYVDFGHGLNAAVNKLREALADSAQEPRYIETLPRRGYRFIGRMEKPGTAPHASAAPATPGRRDVREILPEIPKDFLLTEDWQPDVIIKRRSLVRLGALFALLAFLAVVGFLLLFDPASPLMHEAAEKAERALKLKLAAERFGSHPPSIWRAAVANAAAPEARTRIISMGQEAIGGPQPSPDGKQLAFQSGSTQGGDIWVSNFDGSSPRRLTNIGACGVPRWSPDGHWIVFDTDGRTGHSGIFVVAPESGTIREVVKDTWNNSVGSWSRDGKWIYFASNRAMDREESQVWKVSIGEPRQLVQVTRQGGFSAYESRDGQTLYYAKHRYENPEIWEVPVQGGAETRVSSLLRPSTWANWAVIQDGILFLSDHTEKASTLEYFDFATHGVRPLGVLENASFWLSASADGKLVWYSELTENQARQVFRASAE